MKSHFAEKNFAVGAAVQWKWLGRAVLGTVRSSSLEPITKTIKGKALSNRNGSAENPAYVVESESGNLAFKSFIQSLSFEPKTNLSRAARRCLAIDIR